MTRNKNKTLSVMFELRQEV